MKKIILLLATCLVFLSCDKDNEEAIDPDFVKVGNLMIFKEYMTTTPVNAERVINEMLETNKNIRRPNRDEENEFNNQLPIAYDDERKGYWVGHDSYLKSKSKNSICLSAEYNEEHDDYRAYLFDYYEIEGDHYSLSYGEYYNDISEGAKLIGKSYTVPIEEISPLDINMIIYFVKK